VAEPVQVYLAPDDRDRLDHLAKLLDATKSDILRRGLDWHIRLAEGGTIGYN